VPPADYPQLEAPDAAFARARWIPEHAVDWARGADAILREHGAVSGTQTYDKRYQARWRAQKLIRLLVELRIYERWELEEHTQKRGGQWCWHVEYSGRRSSGD
jgi:hypothetical protein